MARHLFDVKTRKFTRTIRLSAIKEPVRAFAMAPGQGDIYVASQKNLLQRYNALGVLRNVHQVKLVHFISRLRMGAGGFSACQKSPLSARQNSPPQEIAVSFRFFLPRGRIGGVIA